MPRPSTSRLDLPPDHPLKKPVSKRNQQSVSRIKELWDIFPWELLPNKSRHQPSWSDNLIDSIKTLALATTLPYARRQVTKYLGSSPHLTPTIIQKAVVACNENSAAPKNPLAGAGPVKRRPGRPRKKPAVRQVGEGGASDTPEDNESEQGHPHRDSPDELGDGHPEEEEEDDEGMGEDGQESEEDHLSSGPRIQDLYDIRSTTTPRHTKSADNNRPSFRLKIKKLQLSSHPPASLGKHPRRESTPSPTAAEGGHTAPAPRTPSQNQTRRQGPQNQHPLSRGASPEVSTPGTQSPRQPEEEQEQEDQPAHTDLSNTPPPPSDEHLNDDIRPRRTTIPPTPDQGRMAASPSPTSSPTSPDPTAHRDKRARLANATDDAHAHAPATPAATQSDATQPELPDMSVDAEPTTFAIPKPTGDITAATSFVMTYLKAQLSYLTEEKDALRLQVLRIRSRKQKLEMSKEQDKTAVKALHQKLEELDREKVQLEKNRDKALEFQRQQDAVAESQRRLLAEMDAFSPAGLGVVLPPSPSPSQEPTAQPSRAAIMVQAFTDQIDTLTKPKIEPAKKELHDAELAVNATEKKIQSVDKEFRELKEAGVLLHDKLWRWRDLVEGFEDSALKLRLMVKPEGVVDKMDGVEGDGVIDADHDHWSEFSFFREPLTPTLTTGSGSGGGGGGSVAGETRQKTPGGPSGGVAGGEGGNGTDSPQLGRTPVKATARAKGVGGGGGEGGEKTNGEQGVDGVDGDVDVNGGE